MYCILYIYICTSKHKLLYYSISLHNIDIDILTSCLVNDTSIRLFVHLKTYLKKRSSDLAVVSKIIFKTPLLQWIWRVTPGSSQQLYFPCIPWWKWAVRKDRYRNGAPKKMAPKWLQKVQKWRTALRRFRWKNDKSCNLTEIQGDHIKGIYSAKSYLMDDLGDFAKPP